MKREWLTEGVVGLLRGWEAAGWNCHWQGRPVLADAFEDAGADEEYLKYLREGGNDSDVYRDILAGIPVEIADTNWKQCFELAGIPDPCPPTSTVDLTEVKREDVAVVLGIRDGERDDRSWLAYGQLKDGRYFFIAGGCCYTGWDCQGSSTMEVSETLDELMEFGLDKEAKEALISI